MIFLIFSDIHSNLEALKHIIDSEKYDKAIFLGDIVDYGPNPAETLDLVRQEADFIVQGNHDYSVGTGEDCQCSPAMHHLSVLTRDEISLKLLGKNDRKWLADLSTMKEAEIDGKRILMVHASPNNPLFGYLFSTEAEMIWKKADYRRFDYIMVGHTHFPMFYRGKIINPGSSGQPRDGLWKPMYAIMDSETGDLTFKRFRYDRDRMLEKLAKSLEKFPGEYRELKALYEPENGNRNP